MTRSGGRKTIFITGAGSGIGRATALLFAQRGWFVGLYDVDPAGLAETQKLLAKPEQTASGVFDVRDGEAWKNAVGQFGDQTGGRLDILFNNAGIAKGGPFEDVPEDASAAMIAINFNGVVNGAYAALPLLRKTPGARMIATSSAAGIHGVPNLAIYSATKCAVRGLCEALDLEWARHGVRAICLMPYFAETAILDTVGVGSNESMRDQLTRTGGKIYPVSDVAEAAWAAAHGEELYVLVGREAKQAAFAQRFMPKRLRRQLARLVSPR